MKLLEFHNGNMELALFHDSITELSYSTINTI